MGSKFGAGGSSVVQAVNAATPVASPAARMLRRPSSVIGRSYAPGHTTQFHAWTPRDGLVPSYHVYVDTPAMLAALRGEHVPAK
ncbi:MAG: hypothetical protein ABW215_15615 [Kibdelosporangium sp.]